MFKNMLSGVIVIFGMAFLIGCASKGIEVRRYVEVKDRVDQEIEGNAGYIAGDPQPENRDDIRKTRKIYVLEVSKSADVEDDTVIENTTGVSMNVDRTMNESYDDYESDNFIEVSKDSVSLPYKDDIEDRPSASFTEYTVKKDDTLQKISKKFYDSFSKWPKIYEANKDVIENPDRIKPGTVLQIPME